MRQQDLQIGIRDGQVLFDKELERVVLGALLLEKTAIARVGILFRPELFYVGQNMILAEAILSLYRRGAAVDIATVCLEIKKAGKQSELIPQEVMAYTNNVVSTAHLEQHMMKLTELFMSREVQRLAGKAYGRGGDWSEDVFEVVNDLQKGLTDLLAGTMSGGLVGIDRLIVGTLKYIDSIVPGVIQGVPSGILTLDNIFFGYKPQELHIKAARPGCGKTALALQILRNAASLGKRGALFSLEMSSHKINQRMLAAQSGVKFAKIQRNLLETRERELLNEAAAVLAALPIYMDDTFSQNVQVIHSKCVQLMFRSGLDFVIVDYLQLIGANKTSKQQIREQQIAEISRGLKGMAKDLNVPVIALSQMSRDIEKGGRKEPVLSDLRESGALEQDADSVVFLTPEEDDQAAFGDDKTVNVKIAKQRDGARSTFPLIFQGNYMRFIEPDTVQAPAPNLKPVNIHRHDPESYRNEEDGPF